jgi:hypothetical protein
VGKITKQDGMTSWLDVVKRNRSEDMAERVRAKLEVQQACNLSWYQRCMERGQKRKATRKIKELGL